METEILLKGIGVGFAVAAPVGPIGLLCIRRTLAGGRVAGLATGLGAATADAVYGVMVAAGFAATGLLVSYARPMAIGGGLLLALLGLMALRSFLMEAKAGGRITAQASERPIWADYGTTFLLTLSNPSTILAFIGMVAALGASAAGSPWAPYWLVLGVFLGSALWWLILVHIALAARSWISPATTRWFDLGSGALLLVWGAWIVLGAL